MDPLSLIDRWIADHQALVVAVGLPTLIAIASGIVAWLTNKASLTSQEKDRALQKRLRLFDDRRTKIEKLRTAVHRYETASFIFSMDLKSGFSSGEPGTIHKAIAKGHLDQLVAMMLEIQLLVDPNDPDAAELQKALDLKFIIRDKAPPLEEIDKLFFPVCKRIISRMEKEADRIIET